MPKRTQHPPGIRPRGSSGLQIDFRYKKERIRISQKLKPTPANIKFLERKRDAILYEIEVYGKFNFKDYFPGHPIPAVLASEVEMMTISEAVDWWLESIRDKKSKNTIRDNQNSINKHIKPGIGDIKVADITASQIRVWAETIDAKNRTKNNILGVLRMTFSAAYEEELIEKNVMLKVKAFPVENIEVDPLAPDEIDAILNGAEKHHAMTYQFAIWTGLRSGEQAALLWDDIDWENRQVHVTKSSNEEGFTKAKRDTTKRTIELLPPAYEAIQYMKHVRKDGCLWVFPDPRNNGMWNNQSLAKSWKNTLKKAGVRYRRFYNTRHTYASMMLSSGMPTRWVMGQMGHVNSAMLDKTYGRWVSGKGKTVREWVKGKISDGYVCEDVAQFLLR